MIKQALKKYNIEITQDQSARLQSYMEKILEWNEKVNLTAITEAEEFIKKHYADSLSVINLPEYIRASKIIDVGTGGGFPGIPLAIVSPGKDFTLLDSLEKRLKIIDEISKDLGIPNVKTIYGRAEDIGQNPDYRETFELCVSRAVADLAVLSEYCLPLVQPGGHFIAYKGKDIEEELSRGGKAIEILGGKVKDLKPTALGQNLVIIEKVSPTPDKYPRKPGTPRKSPL